VSGLQDLDRVTALLVAHDYDLGAAINTFFASDDGAVFWTWA